MKGLLLGAIACLAALALAPDARANPCDLPDRGTVWVDYAEGSVPYWRVFARPGIVAASSSFLVPPQLRAAGAKTVYWEMYLNSRAGTPTNPAEPATVADWANRIYYRAVASTGCARPWIGLNELFGASTTTPWSRTNARYRANVLLYMQVLAARGARPFLAISAAPYTGGEAADWWREVAKVGDIVREMYFPAPAVHAMGPALGSRFMRNEFRRAIEDFTQIGISPSRLGIFLGFQTTRGHGGREGLRPSSAWFRHIKLQVLAIKQVASEVPFHSVWSWGWATWNKAEDDPDKYAAACVYLWTRDPTLCNGPYSAGRGFRASRREGQIRLPTGVQCRIVGREISSGEVAQLTRVTGDREVAFTTLFGRAVLSTLVRIGRADVDRAESAIVAFRFGGSWGAYGAALGRVGATRGVARGLIADQVREAIFQRRLRVGRPSGGAIRDYYESYGAQQARLVRVTPAPSWLGRRPVGLAISPLAPAQVFRLAHGQRAVIRTPGGRFVVRALGETVPLAAFPLGVARPSITAALVDAARKDAFDRWLPQRQRRTLRNATCLRDDMPLPGSPELTILLPFLELAA